ncbi:MAG: NifB/NifX family molybdenum-iron cluster-binding protein [Spirochaetales bacterium]|nr:NifB/NifX family molybdenum-iron cluster-binding protein [Spirochaetales bacterium]
MKICVTAKGPSPLSEMDTDFERCGYFTFFIDGGRGFDAVKNNRGDDPVQLLLKKNVDVVITKTITKQSKKRLDDVNIRVYFGVGNSIREEVVKFEKGELVQINKFNPILPE